jgi:hypothetical protein
MFSVYGGKSFSRKAVHKWVEKSSQGCSKVADDARPGRPVQTATEAAVQRQCSNFTRVFPWFSIQHNSWSFEVSESVRHGGCPENWMLEKKLTEWVCPCNISYGTSMQMKTKICLTGLLLETNHECITTKPNRSVLRRNGNIPVHLQPKSLRLCVRHQLGSFAYRVLGFSGSTVSPFSEAWWKCKFCIALWSSGEASGCSSQKSPGQLARGALLDHDNARLHTDRAIQGRIQELQ